MRVTNEQAKADCVIDTTKISFAQSMLFPVTIENYARDLLEARALLKESILIIEATRKFLPQITSLPRIKTEQGDCVKAIESFIEKSKEYAE